MVYPYEVRWPGGCSSTVAARILALAASDREYHFGQLARQKRTAARMTQTHRANWDVKRPHDCVMAARDRKTGMPILATIAHGMLFDGECVLCRCAFPAFQINYQTSNPYASECLCPYFRHRTAHL